MAVTQLATEIVIPHIFYYEGTLNAVDQFRPHTDASSRAINHVYPANGRFVCVTFHSATACSVQINMWSGKLDETGFYNNHNWLLSDKRGGVLYFNDDTKQALDVLAGWGLSVAGVPQAGQTNAVDPIVTIYIAYPTILSRTGTITTPI